jgi:Fic family protein
VAEEAPVVDEGYQPFPDISAWTAVPFDPTTYDQYAALLESARAEASEEARDHAVRTAIRYAGTDTGAIEGLYTTDRGFTRTVAIEAAHWEAAANERGPNAAQVIKDQIEAYEWLLDLVTESRPVTEHVVRELHAMLCRTQDTYVVQTEVGPQERPLPKGEYKKFPNNPTSLATGQVHHYAPPDMVAPEVHRLVESLSTEAYANAHPVVQAAYLHYGLVAIHPFADGNGRTTRALASVPLYKALRVPLIVLADERDAYLDTLASADGGNLGAFVGFVVERVLDAVELVNLTVRAGGAADEARSLDRLRQVVTSVGGHTHAELDAIADRLQGAVQVAVADRIRQMSLPAGITMTIVLLRAQGTALPDYRSSVATPFVLRVIAASTSPANAEAAALVRVLIATRDSLPTFLLELSDQDSVPFGLRDVEPTVRQVAKIKIEAALDRLVPRLLADLAERAEASLRNKGYLG